eukprot:6492093-Amphidinium_carterae.1
MALQNLGLQPQAQEALEAEIRRAVDVQVEQRLRDIQARPGPSRLFDTKLGKPPEFSGSVEKFDEFRFKLESYLCALDPALRTLLHQVSVDVERERKLADLTDQEKNLSTQMYYALAMVCKDSALSLVRLAEGNNGLEAYRLLLRRCDPQTETRGLVRLSRIVNPQWQAESLLDSIIQWEREIQEYESLTREVLPDSVKCAVLTEKSPEDVKTYLLLNAGANLDYSRLRLTLESYLQARPQQDEPKPMEIDAITKGKWGKGRGKGKDYPGKGGKEKGKDKYQNGYQSGKGDKGKQTAQFPGYCRKCGKWGHKAVECRSGSPNNKGGKKGVNAVTDQPPEPDPNTSMVGAITLQELLPNGGWIGAVTSSTSCALLVDSGAVVHVCGPNHYDEFETQPFNYRMPTLLSAQGRPIACYGRKRV